MSSLLKSASKIFNWVVVSCKSQVNSKKPVLKPICPAPMNDIKEEKDFQNEARNVDKSDLEKLDDSKKPALKLVTPTLINVKKGDHFQNDASYLDKSDLEKLDDSKKPALQPVTPTLINVKKEDHFQNDALYLDKSSLEKLDDSKKPALQPVSPTLINVKKEDHFQNDALYLDKSDLEKWDDSKLGVFLNSACGQDNLKDAFKVFHLISTPRKKDFSVYLSLLRRLTMSSGMSNSNIHSELIGIWRKIVTSGYDGDSQILISFFEALCYSNNYRKQLLREVVSKPALETFHCGVLACFLTFCLSTFEKELAKEVWKWGESIRQREVGSELYFLTQLQYFHLFGDSLNTLKILCNQIIEHGLHDRLDLVKSMCSALSMNSKEQKRFISLVISNPPNQAFDCSVFEGFFKHCFESKDKELAKEIWKWGESILERERRTFEFFRNWFQYRKIVGATIDELKKLWDEVRECCLNEREELVREMHFALEIDADERMKFISMIVSNPPSPAFDSVILKSFIATCLELKQPTLAQNIWSWGLNIRVREKGRVSLGLTTGLYVRVCSISGNVDLIESVWKEAEHFGVVHVAVLKNAYVTCLAENAAIEHIVRYFDQVGLASLNGSTLAITLKAFFNFGEDVKALDLLRRFQKENPNAVSIISYNLVFHAFSSKGNFDVALSVIQEAKSHGHEANEITWRPILNLLQKRRDLPMALKACEVMKSMNYYGHSLHNVNSIIANLTKESGDSFKTNREILNKALERSNSEILWKVK